MIGWSKIELCWSVTKQAFDNHFDFYLTGLYKKSMRRQLENFANALSDYSGLYSITKGCEFALPFVFSPYFADTYGEKGWCLLSTYSSNWFV